MLILRRISIYRNILGLLHQADVNLFDICIDNLNLLVLLLSSIVWAWVNAPKSLIYKKRQTAHNQNTHEKSVKINMKLFRCK